MNSITHDTYVRARIDAATKERAVEALADMGLSVSDAIRLLLIRVADERRLPFEVKAPNRVTREAIAELEAGGGKEFATVADLMADLYADD
ncbi:MAG: type II toxin-antitoxin system RelB/DinJ family antitoxin [Desulfovibrio sp.]|jgi:DNA-damage-inducible protein J|nr:type II toxin-antitoxin system RelB/DinJ family antitoxin [Desulfovibrio sp.]